MPGNALIIECHRERVDVGCRATSEEPYNRDERCPIDVDAHMSGGPHFRIGEASYWRYAWIGSRLLTDAIGMS